MVPFLYSCSWRTETPPFCSHTQKSWLGRSGALTAGLRTLGSFSLSVVSQGVELALSEEKDLMGHAPLWRREVLMSIDGIPCVLARSVTLLRASHGCWQGMRKLGRRPLADLLYHDPGIARSVFEVSRIGRHHGLYQSLIRTGIESTIDSALFARRSVFWRQNQPLMVSECFLPTFWKLATPGY